MNPALTTTTDCWW